MKTILGTLAKTIALIAGAALLAGVAARTTATIAAAALHPALAIALTGTAAVTTQAPRPTPTVTPAAVAAGTVLTADQATNLPNGTVAYKTQDGTLIAVVHGQQFPDAVVKDVANAAKAAFPGGITTARSSSPAGYIADMQVFDTWAGTTAQALGGGTIIVVVDGVHYAAPGTQTHGRWIEITNRFRNANPYPGRTQAVAAANADASRMVPAMVVVLDY